MVFTPEAGYNGWGAIMTAANDEGHNGYGGPQITFGKVDLKIGSQIVAENSPVLLNAGQGNQQFIISDPDVGDVIIVDLETWNSGGLSLGTTTGLTGDPAGMDGADGMMHFSGSLADVNAALATLSFIPNADYSGPARLRMDVGNEGYDTWSQHIMYLTVDAPPGIESDRRRRNPGPHFR